MRIDIVFPVLPPILDGIGDHTARLAEALAAHAHAQVRVLTAQREYESIPGVSIKPAFSAARRRDFSQLAQSVQEDPPDWLLLQYNQFSYGRWGLNPFVPLTIRKLKKSLPALKLAVLFHEDFVPLTNWKNLVMTTWQRAQFYALGRQADCIFFSIEPWVERYRAWFPGIPVHHAPVGSNIPYVKTDRTRMRHRLDISDDTIVLGVFGSLHASRLLGHIREAAEAVANEVDDSLLLYIGPHGPQFKEAMRGLSVYDAGRLSSREVSRHFAAMDVHLAPFVDGVSTRRGSVMVGLQHGLPTVTTAGPLTDGFWLDEDGQSLFCPPVENKRAFGEITTGLCVDRKLREQVAKAAGPLYAKRFDWPILAARLTRVLTTNELEHAVGITE